MYCSKCGKKLEDDANFCQSCGKKVFREDFHETKDLHVEKNSVAQPQKSDTNVGAKDHYDSNESNKSQKNDPTLLKLEVNVDEVKEKATIIADKTAKFASEAVKIASEKTTQTAAKIAKSDIYNNRYHQLQLAKIIFLVASALIIIGPFLDCLSISALDNTKRMNLMNVQEHMGDGYFYIGLAAIGVILTLFNKKIPPVVTSSLSTVMFMYHFFTMRNVIAGIGAFGVKVRFEFGFFLIVFGSLVALGSSVFSLVTTSKMNKENLTQ